ncbi:MAG: hypothetical protein ACOYOF_01420 [Verrucomicrobiaceae bacterium]
MPSVSPVTLEVNFPRVFVVGCPSFFEFSLLNASHLPLHDIVLNLNCALLGLIDHVIKLASIDARESRLLHVDVIPQAGGSQPIRCLLDAVQDRNSVRIAGVCSDLIVYERPESPANISVIVKDIQSHRSTGEKAEFGGVKGDVNIHVTDLLPNVQTTNDLLQLRLPDSFIHIRLDPITAPDACEMLSIPAPFLRYFEPADVMQLTPSDGSPDDGAAAHGWRLCAGCAEVSLGRSSQDADLVTRYLPATKENNAKSAVLSRKHALLRMKESEASLSVESLSAHSLVRVGAVQLRPGCPTPVPATEVLSVGPALADLRLRCTVRKPLLPRNLRVANLSEWIGNRVTQGMNEEGNWGRIEFDYLNSAPALWQTLWFQRHIPFGQGHGAAFTIDSPHLDGITGYIHHLRGGFWIECASNLSEAIIVDGHPLRDGDLVPLRDGMKLLIGKIAITLKRVR